jgi:hypothetical protein
MKIIKTTPADLLYKYGIRATKKEGNGRLFMKATFCCDECSFQKDILIGKDETVYHACNRGNVVNHVARLTNFICWNARWHNGPYKA